MTGRPDRDFSFTARPPGPPLSACVELIWHAAGLVPYEEERILPTGRAVLIFNLGDGFHVRPARDETRAQAQTMSRAWVCGVQSRYLCNRPLGRTEMVGVTLRPGGLRAVLGAPADTFTDGLTDLDLLWGTDAERLRDRLWHARTPARRIALLEAALARRLAAAEIHRIPQAAATLLAAAEPRPVIEIARACEISRKHLAALFRAEVGIPPRLFARITRFDRLLALMAARPALSLADAAQSAGYYDQPHLNRDFADLTGLTPTHYLGQRATLLGPAAEHDESRNFVPTR